MQVACGYGNCKHVSRSVKAAQRHTKTHPMIKAEQPAKGSLFTVRWARNGTIEALVASPKVEVA